MVQPLDLVAVVERGVQDFRVPQVRLVASEYKAISTKPA
jgi:hypothetical protein